jgi:hypothetical protein
MLFNTHDDETGFEEKLTYWLPVQRDPCVLALTDGGFLRSYDVRGPRCGLRRTTRVHNPSIIGTAFGSLPIRMVRGSMGYSGRPIIFHAKRFLIRPPR